MWQKTGLTLSIPKTKAMAVGREVTIEDRTPLSVGGEEIEKQSLSFHILQIESSSRMTLDVEKRVAQASKPFKH